MQEEKEKAEVAAVAEDDEEEEDAVITAFALESMKGRSARHASGATPAE